jgi:two-component system nitrogen regulation sensor histidine kinase NtrY
MALKSFFLNTVIRVILITITCFIFVRIYQQLEREYIFSLAGIILLILFQVILLTRFVNKTNRDLTRFLSAVKNEDSTLVFDEIQDNLTYRYLYKSLNELKEVINSARADSVKKSLFLTNLVNHVGVGLIIFSSEGNVEMINHAARKILGVHSLNSIHDLQKGTDHDLPEILLRLKPGKPELVRFIREYEENHEFGQIQKLLLKKDIIKSEEKIINLVSMQNIITELERNELDSWQKLIRVLTHEIMNSVSPVISLTKTISNYFTRQDKITPILPEAINGQIIEKTISGLDTIRDTGERLMDFVSKYRRLNQLPKPEFVQCTIISLFDSVKQLMSEGTDIKNITIDFEIDQPGLTLFADTKQLEHLLVNLIKNSVEAIGGAGNGKIMLRAFKRDDDTFLQVEDNGPGIPGDIIDNIFIPFFTTKDTGSGIGLSLSRQIMLLHGGTISVHSVPGLKTVFTMQF